MEAIYRSTFPYCLVQFAEEGTTTISVVPTSWLMEDEGIVYTWWPKDSVKRHTICKSHPQDGWNMFLVKVLHYSRNYSSALESLRFCDIRTDIELCSEEESEPIISPSPKLKKSIVPEPCRVKLETDCLIVPQATNCKENRGNYSPALESLRFCDVRTDIELCPEEEPEPFISPSSKLKKSKVPEPSCSVKLETDCLIVPQATNCSNCKENRAMLDKVMVTLNCIMEEIKEIKRLQHLALPQSCDAPLINSYPLSSVADVKSLEEGLVDEDLFLKLAKYLGQYGGKDVNDCTRRVLPLLMTNETSRGINWVGGFGKVGMKSFPRILKLIAVAVRQTDKNAKQAAVEEIVKRWLRTACDRDGGRSKRKIAALEIE